MKVQCRPTRRDHLGRVLSRTYRVIIPKQGMLDFMPVGGRNYWARAADAYSLGLWPGGRPPAVTRPARIRDIAYMKNGRRQLSFGLTTPIDFTRELRQGMAARCRYMGDHLLIIFSEPVFTAYMETQQCAKPLILKKCSSSTRSVA